MGFDGVEFDGKRPHANPMDLTPWQRREIVKEAGDLGLEIAGVASTTTTLPARSPSIARPNCSWS